MGFGEPLSRDAGHLQLIERILGNFLSESGHCHAELFGEMPCDIYGMPVPGLSCQHTEGTRYFAQDLRGLRDALLHLRVHLVKARCLLENAVINSILALLVSGRADHAILETIPVPPEKCQVDRDVAVGPLDLFEPVHDLVALFLRDHEEGIPLHLLLELVLLVVKFLPEIVIIKESLRALFLHICEDQHAAGEILGKLSDLLHSAHALFLGHVDECDLKVLPALADGHAAAKIDGFILLLGHEINLVRHRRNVRGAG